MKKENMVLNEQSYYGKTLNALIEDSFGEWKHRNTSYHLLTCSSIVVTYDYSTYTGNVPSRYNVGLKEYLKYSEMQV